MAQAVYLFDKSLLNATGRGAAGADFLKRGAGLATAGAVGGGTTLEAARQLCHRCVGFEITPNNYAKAAARLGL